MKRIEILTSHNIVITHELASVGQRILAFSIDAGILGAYASFIAIISGGSGAIFYIGIGLVLIFYHLIWEIFNQGQSPGKIFLKLRVVSLQGMTPTLMTYVTRWAFRLIDITLTVGSMAILSILLSHKGQRIGDLLGRSTVIQLSPYNNITLNNMQQLDHQGVEIHYPQVRQYTDQDMLLVKQSIQRYYRDKHPANEKMIYDLAIRISTDLNIPIRKQAPLDFLKAILSEYILLTRV